MSAIRTWLVTGASSGLGKSLALEALKAGQKVIGTTRDVRNAEESCPEFEKGGGIWLAVDPAQKDSQEVFTKASQEHKVDVLVNNAGYAFIGGVEDTSEADVRAQMEVNFYGPLRSVKACLPVMRERGSGDVVLISSGAGKFAIEAVHESLLYELNTFNINVLVIEPGAFRTPFSFRTSTPAAHEQTGGFSPAYKGTAVEQMLTMSRGITDINSFAKGDPDKAAKAILTAVLGGHEYLRMPLGKDCVSALETKIGQLQADLNASRSLAESTEAD